MISKECKLMKVTEGEVCKYYLYFEPVNEKIDLEETETKSIKDIFDKLIKYMFAEKDYVEFTFVDDVDEGETVFYKSGSKYVVQLNSDIKKIFEDYNNQFNE